MKHLIVFWNKITHTKALEQASGMLEISFFESLYRVTYLIGMSTSDHSVLYLVYSYIVKFWMFLFLASVMWYISTIEWTIDIIIDSVIILIIQFCAIYKYKIVVIHKDTFKHLASSMESVKLDLSTKERKKKLNTWITRNDFSLKLLFGIGTCTIITWYNHYCINSPRFPTLKSVLADFYSQKVIPAKSTSLGALRFQRYFDQSFYRYVYPFIDDVEYNLPVQLRLPFNFAATIPYTFTYICVMIVFTYFSFFVMVNDLIVQAHLMNLLCQFNVLEDCLRNILKDCNANYAGAQFRSLLLNPEFQQKYTSRLGMLVDQHKMILENTFILRDVLSRPMLAHLSVSTTLLGSIGYQLAITIDVNFTKGLMSFLFLGYNMFVLYIICRWCEEVKFQSESIRDAVYCSGWESGITTMPGVRKRLLLILARSNKSVALLAGGMYDLSLASYANMVKTSYSAVTLLLRLR